MAQQTKPVGVLTKAVEVLRTLATSEVPLGPTEVARATGIDRSAAHRILATLARERMVTRVDGDGTYQLGPLLTALGLAAMNRFDLRRTARPHLEALHDRLGETVNLSILDHDAALCIDMIEARHGLRMSGSIGTRDSLVRSSLGKALLGHLPAERREALAAALPLDAATPHSITGRDRLARELALVRERGYALDKEENELGVCCVGAPILGGAGMVVGAISASVPTVRFTRERRDEIVAAVVATAERISRELDPLAPTRPAGAQADRRGASAR